MKRTAFFSSLFLIVCLFFIEAKAQTKNKIDKGTLIILPITAKQQVFQQRLIIVDPQTNLDITSYFPYLQIVIRDKTGKIVYETYGTQSLADDGLALIFKNPSSATANCPCSNLSNLSDLNGGKMEAYLMFSQNGYNSTLMMNNSLALDNAVIKSGGSCSFSFKVTDKLGNVLLNWSVPGVNLTKQTDGNQIFYASADISF